MSTDIKLSKAQKNKLIKKGGALGSILARFLPKLIKPAPSFGKRHISPFRIKCSHVSYRCCNSKKVHGFGNSKNSGTKTVRFCNKELDDMTKFFKALEDSDVLMKGITETLENDIKKEVLCL